MVDLFAVAHGDGIDAMLLGASCNCSCDGGHAIEVRNVFSWCLTTTTHQAGSLLLKVRLAINTQQQQQQARHSK